MIYRNLTEGGGVRPDGRLRWAVNKKDTMAEREEVTFLLSPVPQLPLESAESLSLMNDDMTRINNPDRRRRGRCV